MKNLFKVKINPEVKITGAKCKHCGKNMIYKDYCSSNIVIN